MRNQLLIGAALLFVAAPLHAQKSAWRGYLKKDFPAGWQVSGKTFTRVGDGGDLITKETYDNFELTGDWKISKGGNSGILFHVVEDPKYKYVWETGPEMQVLDNKGHEDGKIAKTSAGSNFDMQGPTRDVTKPVGEWNHFKLIVKGPHVEHWLNGVKVVEYDLWSDAWKQQVANSKWKNYPAYGLAHSGHIALQDHGDWVSYRNVKVRRLK